MQDEYNDHEEFPEDQIEQLEKAIYAETDQLVSQGEWSLIGVGGGEDSVPFAYTLGLSQHSLPELITFGLPVEVMGEVLNTLGKRMKDGELSPRDGLLIEGVVNRYVLKLRSLGKLLNFRDTKETLSYFPFVLSYYAAKKADVETMHTIEAYQILWPDKQGRFPTEDEYSIPDYVQPVITGDNYA